AYLLVTDASVATEVRSQSIAFACWTHSLSRSVRRLAYFRPLVTVGDGQDFVADHLPEHPVVVLHVPNPALELKCPKKLNAVAPTIIKPLAAPPPAIRPVTLLQDMIPPLTWINKPALGMQVPVLIPTQVPSYPAGEAVSV